MKKLIIAMSVIAIAISSCNKQASILPANNNAANDLLTTDATHYYHGHQVTHQSEITSYNADGSVVVLTDKINNKTEAYYFDNETQELYFLQQYPSLKPLYTKTLQGKEIREYAIASGEVEHFKQTGKVSQSYLNYLDKFKTRIGYRLWANLNAAAGASVFVAAPMANFAVGAPLMDDNAESFTGPAGVVGQVWSNPFFGVGGGLTVAISMPAGIAFVNFFPPIRNAISSAN